MRRFFCAVLFSSVSLLCSSVEGSEQNSTPCSLIVDRLMSSDTLEQVKAFSQDISEGLTSLQRNSITFEDELSWKALVEYYPKFNSASIQEEERSKRDLVLSLVHLARTLKLLEGNLVRSGEGYAARDVLLNQVLCVGEDTLIKINKKLLISIKKVNGYIYDVLNGKSDFLPLSLLSATYAFNRFRNKMLGSIDNTHHSLSGSEQELKNAFRSFSRFGVMSMGQLSQICDEYQVHSFASLKKILGVPEVKDDSTAKYYRNQPQNPNNSENTGTPKGRHYMKLVLRYYPTSEESNIYRLMQFAIMDGKYDLNTPQTKSTSWNPSCMKSRPNDRSLFFKTPLESITPFEILRVVNYVKDNQSKIEEPKQEAKISSGWGYNMFG